MNELSTSEELQMMVSPKSCNCDICKRTLRYGEIISKLDGEGDKRFMLDLYELLTNLEFAQAMAEEANETD